MKTANPDVIEYDDIDCLILTKELLEDVGDNLAGENKQPKLLKVFVHRIEDITKDTKDKRLHFLMFFLREYVDRIWTDMGIEVTAPINGSYKICNKFFSNIGNRLVNLADFLFNDEDIKYYEEFSNLIEIYEKTLRKLISKNIETKELEKEKKNTTSLDFDSFNLINFNSEKKKAFELLLKANAIISKEEDLIILTGGIKSDFFVDTDKFIYNLQILEKTSDLFVNKIKKFDDITKLAFIGKGNGPFALIFLANTIAQKSSKNFFLVDLKKSSDLGKIKGADVNSKDNICIITDTTTSGDTVQNVAKAIQKENGNVRRCITFFDRELGAREYLHDKGINLHPLLTQTDLEEYHIIGTIPKTGMRASQIENAVIPLAKQKVEEYKKACNSLWKDMSKKDKYNDLFNKIIFVNDKGDQGGDMQGISGNHN